MQQARRLKEELSAFDRSARAILRRMNPRISELEIEAMRTPAANLTGILECLLADDFAPALRKLLELDRLLRKADPLAATATARHGRQARRSAKRSSARSAAAALGDPAA